MRDDYFGGSYGSDPYGRRGPGYNSPKKTDPEPAKDGDWKFFIGWALVCIVYWIVCAQFDESARKSLGWIVAHLPEVALSIAVLGGLGYWSMNAESMESVTLATGLFRIAVGLIVLYFGATVAMEMFTSAVHNALRELPRL